MTMQTFVSSQAAAQQVYHSFSGFEQMRAQARDGDSEALSGAAKQFESVFVQMMLKAMRDTVPEGGLFESEQMDFYEGMFDQQLSLNIANGKGIGLAAVIERQLGAGKPTEKPGATVDGVSGAAPETALKMPRRSPLAALSLTARPMVIDQQRAAQTMRDDSAQRARTPATTEWQPASPEAFTDALRPHARRAAATLGVSENLLIAQAALETGWGQKVIPRNEGGSSFNLFGIKASAEWQGDKASTATLEYRDGIAQRERAEFRAYASVEQSFDDYVAFLRQQPRYSEVLQAGDDKAFIQGLQSAGYATDPAYAQKILALKERLDGGSALELAAGLNTRDDRS